MAYHETYTVKKGDNLTRIARNCGISSWQSLREMNAGNEPYYSNIMRNPNLIYPGWVLWISGGQELSHNHTPSTDSGTCITSTPIYSDCKKASQTGTLTKGADVNISEICGANNLYHIDQGWVSVNAIELALLEVEEVEVDNTEYLANVVNDIASMGTVGETNILDILIDNANGIHGMPYQFMESVDGRLNSNVVFGRKYIERIVTKMPLVLMTPGVPDFLPSWKDNDKQTILEALAGLISGSNDIKDNLDKLLSPDNTRYYTFRFAYDKYYNYVNAMLRYCAVTLGIGNVIHGTNSYDDKLSEFKWDKAVNDKLKGFINSKEYIAFYVDSENSISESFTNGTTTSQLSNAFDTVSSQARELAFLAGPIAGAKIDSLNSESNGDDPFSRTVDTIKDIATQHLGGNKLFSHIAEGFKTIGKGNKLIFPEIWDDSDFSKSYDFNIKLRTPDADKVSWFLNICVPMIHMICLAAPRSYDVNSIMAPFLVRAYYKGIFNCDMGIITSLSISKGKDSAWTVDGLPTEVDMSVSIKDLYGMLSISGLTSEATDITGQFNFFRNTCLIDYLSNTCGVNINKAEVSRVLETYIIWAKNSISDIFSNQWLKFNNSLSNFASDLYGKIIFKP